nr:collagen alpha-1(I) chain-like [Equus asinus]
MVGSRSQRGRWHGPSGMETAPSGRDPAEARGHPDTRPAPTRDGGSRSNKGGGGSKKRGFLAPDAGVPGPSSEVGRGRLSGCPGARCPPPPAQAHHLRAGDTLPRDGYAPGPARRQAEEKATERARVAGWGRSRD